MKVKWTRLAFDFYKKQKKKGKSYDLPKNERKIKRKRPPEVPVGLFCAQNRSRTCTPFRTLPPQGSASTNSAIWAW